MLPIVALLLACGGPSELSQPSAPPDPWPMSKAVLAHASATQEDAPAEEPAEEQEEAVPDATGPGEAAPSEEAPTLQDATPPEAP